VIVFALCSKLRSDDLSFFIMPTAGITSFLLNSSNSSELAAAEYYVEKRKKGGQAK